MKIQSRICKLLKSDINWCIISIYYLSFTASASVSVIAPFFPSEAAKKGMSTTLSGAVFSIYGFVLILANIFTGKLLPIVGSRLTLTAGILSIGLSNIAFGLIEYVDTYETFAALCFLVRSAEAIGAALVNTTSYTIIMNSCHDQSTKPMSINEVCSSIGYTVGPVVGSLLFTIGGYKLPFMVLGIAILINLPISLFLVPQQKEFDENKDYSNSLTYMRLVAIPKVIVMCLVVIVVGNNFSVLSSTLALHLQSFGISINLIGYVFLLIALPYIVVALIVGHYLIRSHSFYFFLVGAIVNTVGFAFIGPSPFLSFMRSFTVVAIGLFAVGVGNALALIPTLPTILGITVDKGYPDDVTTFSLVSGLWTTVYSFEYTMGPLFGGVIYDFYGFEWLATIIAASNLIIAAIVCFPIFYGFHSNKQTIQLNGIEAKESTRISKKEVKTNGSANKLDSQTKITHF